MMHVRVYSVKMVNWNFINKKIYKQYKKDSSVPRLNVFSTIILPFFRMFFLSLSLYLPVLSSREICQTSTATIVHSSLNLYYHSQVVWAQKTSSRTTKIISHTGRIDLQNPCAGPEETSFSKFYIDTPGVDKINSLYFSKLSGLLI
jgi:hypothetical protein